MEQWEESNAVINVCEAYYRRETTLTFPLTRRDERGIECDEGYGFIIKINHVIRLELMEINNASRRLFPDLNQFSNVLHDPLYIS